MNGYRVSGDDGNLYGGELGDAVTGDATSSLDVLAGGTAGSGRGKGFWLVVAKAPTGSIFGTVPVGRIFPAAGDEIPIAGDSAQHFEGVEVAELVGWEAQISQKEVDNGVLKDEFDQFGLGKKSFEGKISGQYIQGETDKVGGMLNRYFPIISKNAAGVVSYAPAANTPLYILGYVKESEIPGDTSNVMFAKVYLLGFNLGAKSGQTQTFESKIRLAGLDPCFLNITNPLT